MRTAPPLQNLFYFGLFFVYLPLLPIEQETQPFLALIPILLYFIHAALSGNPNRVPHQSLYIFALIGVIVARLILDMVSGGGAGSVVWAVKYLIGPCAFLYACQATRAPSEGALILVMLANLVLMVLLMSDFTAALMQPLMDALFGRYSSGDQFRGISLFSPEPSYAVNYLVLFFLFGMFYVRNKTTRMFLIFSTVLLLASNRSLTAYVYGLAALLWLIWKSRPAIRLFALGSGVLLAMLLLQSERFQMMAETASSIDFDNLVIAASLLEPSGTTRILIAVLATLGGIESIIGHGLGSFGADWSQTVLNFGWSFYFDHEVIGRYYSEGLALPPNSFLSSLIYDTGIFGLTWFLLFMVWYFRQLRNRVPDGALIYLIAVFCFFNFVFQGQVSNPIPWAVMGMALSRIRLAKNNQ